MFLENYFFRGHYVSLGSYLIVDISVYMRHCTWQFHRSYFDFLQQPYEFETIIQFSKRKWWSGWINNSPQHTHRADSSPRHRKHSGAGSLQARAWLSSDSSHSQVTAVDGVWASPLQSSNGHLLTCRFTSSSPCSPTPTDFSFDLALCSTRTVTYGRGQEEASATNMPKSLNLFLLWSSFQNMWENIDVLLSHPFAHPSPHLPPFRHRVAASGSGD